MKRHLLLAGSMLALGAASSASGSGRPGLQAPSSAVTGGVTGFVFDSLARRPLSGALVQIVNREGATRFSRGTVTDSLGRFVLSDVPEGLYRIGFRHPALDSLSLEPVERELAVGSAPTLGVELAVPSWKTLRTAICGSPSGPGAVVLGIVRDARSGLPVRGAAVEAEWTELAVTRRGFSKRVPRKATVTGDNGGFAFCEVPSPGLLAMVASRGADSTDQLELRLPGDDLVRRDLFLRGPANKESALPAIGGVVFSEEGGRPIPNAEVRVGGTDGPRVRTNAQGEFSLGAVPMGSRMVTVRAIGFVPNRVPVNIVPDVGPMVLYLSSFKMVLDTVRVTGLRLNASNMRGFDQRRQSAGGRFITAAEIERRNPFEITDMLARVPGMKVERAGTGTRVLLRGMFSGYCSPTVYVNGMSFWDLEAEELEAFVRPNEVAGIEIYTEVTVPPQFSRGMSGSRCGAIVIWTK